MNLVKRWWSAIQEYLKRESPKRCSMGLGLGPYHQDARLVAYSADRFWAKLYCFYCEQVWSLSAIQLLSDYPQLYHAMMGTQWVTPPPAPKSGDVPTPPEPAFGSTNSAILGARLDASSVSSQTLDQGQFQNTLGSPLQHTGSTLHLNE